MTGFARPGTNARPTSTAGGSKLDTAYRGNRPGTTRAITSGGRYLRLGTASLARSGDQFIQVDKLEMPKVAKKVKLY